MLQKETTSDQPNRPAKRRKIANGSRSNFTANALDELPWDQVPFPERFEDAEGFLGLEEVSDVEVIKKSGSQLVEYRKVAKKKEKPPKSGEKSTQDSYRSHRGADLELEEWSGFEDQDENQNERKKKQKRPQSTDKDKLIAPPARAKQNGPKEDRRSEKASSSGGDSQHTNAFTTLERETLDDGLSLHEWNDLSLDPQTLAALSRLNFMAPTPIQKKAIPLIQAGHDIVGKASTGSGKTLAFGIPIYEHVLGTRKLKERKEPQLVTALILSPTRELAHQLSSHLSDLSLSDLSITTLTGGLSVYKQQRLLGSADVVIATPGRLWELVQGNKALLENLKQAPYLVLDEADRLLSEGHFKELQEFLDALESKDDDQDETSSPPNRQTLVFSATFQKDLQRKLAGRSKQAELLGKRESMEYLLRRLKFRERPRFVDVNPVSQMASRLKESIVECANLEKDAYLYSVLLMRANLRALVFTNSVSSVRRLTPLLQNLNLKVHAIHSQMPQKARLRAIERFSGPLGSSEVLVATDVAARGLDIPKVDFVLHYHVPRAADMYIHRSGRTARAERSGESILLCAPDEVQGVRRLIAKIHARNDLEMADSGKKFFIQTLELDRRLITRLKPRVTLSKKIADAGLAKEKKNHETNWLRTAAEDLGVEYDSEEFAATDGGNKRGRGKGNRMKEKEARSLSKADIAALRAELKEELGKRVNVGVSEKYLTAGGGAHLESLIDGEKGDFYGFIDD